MPNFTWRTEDHILWTETAECNPQVVPGNECYRKMAIRQSLSVCSNRVRQLFINDAHTESFSSYDSRIRIHLVTRRRRPVTATYNCPFYLHAVKHHSARRAVAHRPALNGMLYVGETPRPINSRFKSVTTIKISKSPWITSKAKSEDERYSILSLSSREQRHPGMGTDFLNWCVVVIFSVNW